MSKLLDRLHITHEAPEHEAPTRVPESREVVEHGRRAEEPPRRAASGIRWLRWIPAIALLAVGILAVTMLVSDSGTEETIEYTTVSEGPGSNSLNATPVPGTATVSSQKMVQDDIDAALVANQPALAADTASSQQIVQDHIDAALLLNQPALAAGAVSSQPIVQDYIDAALLLNQPAAKADTVSSQQIVQDYIDAALLINQPAAKADTVSSQQIVQDYIDEALAANNPAIIVWANPTTGPGSTSLGPTD